MQKAGAQRAPAFFYGSQACDVRHKNGTSAWPVPLQRSLRKDSYSELSDVPVPDTTTLTVAPLSEALMTWPTGTESSST